MPQGKCQVVRLSRIRHVERQLHSIGDSPSCFRQVVMVTTCYIASAGCQEQGQTGQYIDYSSHCFEQISTLYLLPSTLPVFLSVGRPIMPVGMRMGLTVASLSVGTVSAPVEAVDIILPHYVHIAYLGTFDRSVYTT